MNKSKRTREHERLSKAVAAAMVAAAKKAPDAKQPEGGLPTKVRRMFQVDFTSIIVDKVKRPEQRTFVFDGQWFVDTASYGAMEDDVLGPVLRTLIAERTTLASLLPRERGH